MKSVCVKHVIAYEVSSGCPWCVPEALVLPQAPLFNGRIDIALPDAQSKGKGFEQLITLDVRLPVMLHLRESYVVDAKVVRWDGTVVPHAVCKMNGVHLEKTFCLDTPYGSWVASYLGLDGEVWTAHLIADTDGIQWTFRVREHT